MSSTLTITLNDEAIEALATAIAAKLGGAAPDNKPELQPVADPPAAADKQSKGKGKSKAEPEPPPAEEPAAEEPAPTTDLVTQKQIDSITASVEGTDVAQQRDDLTTYYVGQGQPDADVRATLASMSNEEVAAAFTDYLARLVVDETGEFPADFETPYIATRINDGVESLKWVIGGVTLTDEQCAEKKLADPNKKAEEKKPALPKRTLKPGAKK
jgi:hypothetical protein